MTLAEAKPKLDDEELDKLVEAKWNEACEARLQALADTKEEELFSPAADDEDDDEDGAGATLELYTPFHIKETVFSYGEELFCLKS